MTEAVLLPTDEEPMRPDRCGTCRFWQPIDPDNMTPEDRVSFTDGESDHVQGGECKRHPPVITDSHRYDHKPGRAGSLTARWLDTVSPITLDDDWCGEWQSVGSNLGAFSVFVASLSARARRVLDKFRITDWDALSKLSVKEAGIVRACGDRTLSEIATKARERFGRCPIGWDDYLPGGKKNKA